MSNDTATEPEQTPAPATPVKEPRTSGLPSWAVQGLVSLSAIVLALVVGAILIIIGDDQVKAAAGYFGAAPMDTISAAFTAVGEAYKALAVGALGGLDPISESLTQATPLICGGLAVSLAFRTGLFNIGAQGQLIMGAILAAYVGFAWQLPPGLHLVVAVIAGLIGGAIWGGVVGLLKARTGAHEVIVTIMLNYIAYYLLFYALSRQFLLQAPGSANPKSLPMKDSATLPKVLGDQFNLHLGFVLALVAVGVVWWLLNRSTLGYRIRAVGENSHAARASGINVGRTYTIVMMIAGSLLGLAGINQVLGTVTSGVSLDLDASIGFDAITVALLGRSRPFGILAAGLLFGALKAGGFTMQTSENISVDLVLVVQSLIVLFLAAPPLVRAIFRLPTQEAK